MKELVVKLPFKNGIHISEEEVSEKEYRKINLADLIEKVENAENLLSRYHGNYYINYFNHLFPGLFDEKEFDEFNKRLNDKKNYFYYKDCERIMNKFISKIQMIKSEKNCEHDYFNIVYVSSKCSYGMIISFKQINNKDSYILNIFSHEIYMFDDNSIIHVLEEDIEEPKRIMSSGVVNHINRDGTYDITYDDNSYDFNIQFYDIRKSNEQIKDSFASIGKIVEVKFDEVILKGHVLFMNDKYINIKCHNDSKYNLIITNIPKKCIISSNKSDNKNKLSIGEKVNVINRKNALNAQCEVLIEKNYYLAKLIHYDFNKEENIIYEVPYNDKLRKYEIKHVKDYIYNVNEEVIYKDDSDYKFGIINEINNDEYKITDNKEDNEVKLPYKKIIPSYESHYKLFQLVDVNLTPFTVVPGLIIRCIFNASEICYDIYLPNGIVLKNISEKLLTYFKYYAGRKVIMVDPNTYELKKSKIHSIEDNCTYTLQLINDMKVIKNILRSDFFEEKEYNFNIGKEVLIKENDEYYHGYICNYNKSKFCVFYGNGHYSENVYKKCIIEYVKPSVLYEIGEKVIYKGNEYKINSVNNDKYELYANSVLIKDICKDQLQRIKIDADFKVGDIVKYDKDEDEYQIIMFHFNNKAYDIKRIGGTLVKYFIESDKLTKKRDSCIKYNINDEIYYFRNNNRIDGIIHSITLNGYTIKFFRGNLVGYETNVIEEELHLKN